MSDKTPTDTPHSVPAAEAKPAPEAAARQVQVDPKILELLVCPLTKTRLDYDAAGQELISRAAGLAFPIRDGIPIMLTDHARELDAPSGK